MGKKSYDIHFTTMKAKEINENLFVKERSSTCEKCLKTLSNSNFIICCRDGSGRVFKLCPDCRAKVHEEKIIKQKLKAKQNYQEAIKEVKQERKICPRCKIGKHKKHFTRKGICTWCYSEIKAMEKLQREIMFEFKKSNIKKQENITCCESENIANKQKEMIEKFLKEKR